MFSGLGKLFGMQDIEVGHEVFDRDFIIQGTSAPRVRGLFGNAKIRTLIQKQPRIDLRVKDDEGWFQGKFPDGVDELYFVCSGVIKDMDQLRGLFELFAEVLNQLRHEGKAYEDDVDLHIERLKGPGGRIESKKILLWEGDEPRRHAAEALGHLGDAKAVPVLASVLRDVDPGVRANAIAALARISHQRAVRPLIPLLGDTLEVDGQRIRSRAADALRNMGEHAVVDARLDRARSHRGAGRVSRVGTRHGRWPGCTPWKRYRAFGRCCAVSGNAAPTARGSWRPSRRWNRERRCLDRRTRWTRRWRRFPEQRRDRGRIHRGCPRHPVETTRSELAGFRRLLQQRLFGVRRGECILRDRQLEFSSELRRQ